MCWRRRRFKNASASDGAASGKARKETAQLQCSVDKGGNSIQSVVFDLLRLPSMLDETLYSKK